MQLTQYFPISTYIIEEKSVVNIGGQEYESQLSYTLYIETEYKEKHEINISRTAFKANGQRIDTKYLEIANQYMEALFPLKCKIENYRLIIVNLKEIRKRIADEDKNVCDKYSGEGVEHIRTQFLDATETDKKLSEFIKQLYFMKILNLGMQKFEKKQDYFLKWRVMPIGFSQWKGKIEYSKEENKLHFEPKIDNAQEIMDEVVKYIHKFDYQVDFEEENLPLFADFNHQVNYTGKTGRIEHSETNVLIDVEDKFYYHQQITLQSK